MKGLLIRDNDFKKYRIIINSNELKNMNEVNNIVLNENYNCLKIIQMNITDLFSGKSVMSKVFCGFFVAIIEGLGGTVIDRSIFEAGYSRAKYEAILTPNGSENLELNINLKQNKKWFIPFGKYYFEVKSKNLELRNIVSVNESTKEDKLSWIVVFSIPILISIVAIVLVLISVMKLIIEI